MRPRHGYPEPGGRAVPAAPPGAHSRPSPPPPAAHVQRGTHAGGGEFRPGPALSPPPPHPRAFPAAASPPPPPDLSPTFQRLAPAPWRAAFPPSAAGRAHAPPSPPSLPPAAPLHAAITPPAASRWPRAVRAGRRLAESLRPARAVWRAELSAARGARDRRCRPRGRGRRGGGGAGRSRVALCRPPRRLLPSRSRRRAMHGSGSPCPEMGDAAAVSDAGTVTSREAGGGWGRCLRGEGRLGPLAEGMGAAGAVSRGAPSWPRGRPLSRLPG